jgi:acyl transferase domain-containing protein/acyl carrier protein
MPAMKNEQAYTGLEIAITGISCRFPGASGWREFWANLVNGIESIDVDNGVNDLAQENGFVRAKAVIKDKELFDYSFFEYSPAEAKLLNPVHRVFHQCVWEALEDAGYNPEQIKGPVGLFAGAGDDLNWKIYSSLKNKEDEVDDFTLHLINNKDYLASLVAYKLNFKGPAFVVNTACSTSLVAVSLACKSLLLGESRIALAGGITISTKKQEGYQYQEGMIYSADGHCRAFDELASGTISSEGAGVVVLKRLSEAIKDGDHIYAVIKGTAVNNDGNQKVGYTAPGVDGQAACIKRAMIFAKADPESISYVEAHGTGTRLGDPIEIEALNQAFNYNKGHQCAVGSVKTNIGHTDAAAGVAGLIKTALALKYKKIPPSLHFSTANPDINFSGGPFYISNKLAEWKRKDNAPLRAGVSSFGIGGTNAHAILEEAPEVLQTDAGQTVKLLTLSARTQRSLKQYAAQFRQFLEEEATADPDDLAYTIQTGRKNFAYRLPLVYTDIPDLQQQLKSITSRPVLVRKATESAQVVFLFPGQGSQYAGMCRELYESVPVFRKGMDEGFAIIQEITGQDFRDILFPAVPGDERIKETKYTQPLLFITGYSLAQWLLMAGIQPHYMTGHSIGEYVAACISGVFSYPDALRLVIKRGALMNSLPPGSMLSLGLTAAEAGKYISDTISLAAVNAPEQVVLSGDMVLVEALEEQLKNEGVEYVKLRTSHAFHSAMQDSILDAYREELSKVTLNKPAIPFISNLTGNIIKEEEAVSPAYWVSHLRHTVQFSAGIQTLLSNTEPHVFIEVGAGHSLSGLLKQHINEQHQILCVNMVRSSRENVSDLRYLLSSFGQLWGHGLNIDWKKLYEGQKRNRLPLPVYCFEPVRYPAEVDPLESLKVTGTKKKTERGTIKDWLYYPSWKRTQLYSYPEAKKTKTFLLFCTGNKLSKTVGDELLLAGAKVITVLPAKNYKRLSRFRYTLDPMASEGFKQLVDDISDEPVTDIIYAWGMLAADSRLKPLEENRDFNLVFLCMVKLVQALLSEKLLSDKSIIILTDRLHRVTGAERNSPVQSLLLGLVNILPQEYSVSCCNIDADNRVVSTDPVKGLVNELLSQRKKEDRIVAFRNGQRWVKDYERNTQLTVSNNRALKKGGLYLITGGLGDVGYILADHLIKTYDAKVMLTGRRSVEQQGNMVPIASLVLTLKEEGRKRLGNLQQQSKDVRYFAADISNRAEMKAIVASIELEYGPIDGVIHTAGLVDHRYFELVEDMTIDNINALLLPKINGIRNLYELFGKRRMDFVWITSSIAAELGGLGYGAYSAANLYMDHFLQAGAENLPAWKCVGLAELVFTKEESNVWNALNPADIISLFECTCTITGVPVIYQTIEDLNERIFKTYQVKKEQYLDEEPASVETEAQDRPDLSSGYVAAETDTQRKLQTVFISFFGIKMIGIEDNFFELGGDSLKAMILLKRIQKEFSVRLTLNEFFVKRNIREIAACIDEISLLFTDSKPASIKKIVI